MQIPEITPQELKAELAGPTPPVLVDVREPFELEIARLDPHVLIPMGEFVERMGELGTEDDLVIVCRSGSRSARVTAFLLQQGYRRVRNLAGGVLRWSRDVDPTMRRY
ncbi:MAG: rhodanese-like domain-containing protein [Fimbriimonadaceae bacterium]|nr:rhodanese-like domain-containing protein [Fimbriimonadaceae bacterium]